jgi:hypothetical protein
MWHEKKENEEKSKERKKGMMSEFLDHFQVKRSIYSCLREYTKEHFLHHILNTGLRVLQAPD